MVPALGVCGVCEVPSIVPVAKTICVQYVVPTLSSVLKQRIQYKHFSTWPSVRIAILLPACTDVPGEGRVTACARCLALPMQLQPTPVARVCLRDTCSRRVLSSSAV